MRGITLTTIIVHTTTPSQENRRRQKKELKDAKDFAISSFLDSKISYA